MTIVLGGIQLTMTLAPVQRAFDPDGVQKALDWQRLMGEVEGRRAAALQLLDGNHDGRRWTV